MSTPPTVTGGFGRTVRTVAWALLGVRGHKPEEGVSSLSPLRILVTALVFMLVFVLVLVTVAIRAGSG